MEEIITATTKIFDGRVVKLSVHDVRLPDNNMSKREIVHHSGAVAIIAIDDQNNILLVKQFRLAAKQVLYELPAGVLEPGESPVDCAIRELQEEAGYRPMRIQSFGGHFAAPGYSSEYIHLFHATDLIESPLEQDTDEFVEPLRIPLTEAIAMIEQGEIIDSKTVIGILRIARQMNL